MEQRNFIVSILKYLELPELQVLEALFIY